MGFSTVEAFYDARDKYDIIVWDDFRLNSSGGIPLDINTFNAIAVENLKRLRNHVLIALRYGDNEGDPTPRLNADIKAFSGRHYHSDSHSYNLS
jgi:hypothetical protein